MSARLLHYAQWSIPKRGTRCKTLETACGHFRRSVAGTTDKAEVTCSRCCKTFGLASLSASDVMAVCGPGSTK